MEKIEMVNKADRRVAVYWGCIAFLLLAGFFTLPFLYSRSPRAVTGDLAGITILDPQGGAPLRLHGNDLRCLDFGLENLVRCQVELEGKLLEVSAYNLHRPGSLQKSCRLIYDGTSFECELFYSLVHSVPLAMARNGLGLEVGQMAALRQQDRLVNALEADWMRWRNMAVWFLTVAVSLLVWGIARERIAYNRLRLSMVASFGLAFYLGLQLTSFLGLLYLGYID